MYVLKMKKHEKHAKKSVVKIMHIIIKLNKWLNYVYELSENKHRFMGEGRRKCFI